MMLTNPITKYHAFESIDLVDRTWPSKKLTAPPIWLSTDLRDGNQSLFEPMNVATKVEVFDELVRVGLREIEIGFPAASALDFQFVRFLIEENRIPDHVTPMVITQARDDLIKKTVESLQGIKKAIIHLYTATAPAWREIVFGMDVNQMNALVKEKVAYLKSLTEQYPDTEWILQYSPETFSATELDVALLVCNTAIETWDASPSRKIIINLPSTVENTLPNVFADRVEWMSRHLMRRESVVLAVHPHNDRGCAVASAELAMLAGAERVEGCLFGNGERSGNVDLVTLALNLYTQGIHPQLDFSNINKTARIIEEATKLPIHPRHPYVGDLVFTAFSGSHQDAINKGFAVQTSSERWVVPYLPIDPKDLGRTYESVIRVNSQSGKGGIAYLLERDHGIVIPRKLLVEFSAEVQRMADTSESEISSAELYRLFETVYLDASTDPSKDYQFKGYTVFANCDEQQSIALNLIVKGEEKHLIGHGNGPIDATIHALGLRVDVTSYEERAISKGADASALAIVELSTENGYSRFGVGIDKNIVNASLKAIISAVNRLDNYSLTVASTCVHPYSSVESSHA